jgi:1,4-alpha-glucan branching enzyme
MSKPVGYWALMLHSHIPYVLSHGKSPHGTDWLSESASECYLPLLDTCTRLERAGIPAKFTIGFTPILQEQLANDAFKAELTDYMQRQVDAGLEDQAEFRKKGVLWQAGLAYFWQQFYSQQLEIFKDRLDYSILEGFKRLQESGAIEVTTSAATHGYLALIGLDECVRAQVELGVRTYQKHFGRQPRGFWLPECAYRPMYEWKPPVAQDIIPTQERAGVEAFLSEAGLRYFFVDTHLLRGGQPMGTYVARFPALQQLFKQFLQSWRGEEADRDPYQAYRVPASSDLAVFARDPETTVQVWSGEHGYPGDPHYLEFHKKHYPNMLRYWRVSDHKADLGAKHSYEPYKAFEKIQAHADHFVNMLKDVLQEHHHRTGKPGVLVSMYDTELFGHWWFEGPEWLYAVIRRLASEPEIQMVTFSEYLENYPPEESIFLPEGSWGEGGYHWIWLNEWTTGVWEEIYRAEATLCRLVNQYAADPELQPYLSQLARELLLLESSDWPFLITTWSARDYAEIRVQDHVRRFDQIAGLIENLANGKQPDPEQLQTYEESLVRDAVFPDLDLGWWSARF